MHELTEVDENGSTGNWGNLPSMLKVLEKSKAFFSLSSYSKVLVVTESIFKSHLAIFWRRKAMGHRIRTE